MKESEDNVDGSEAGRSRKQTLKGKEYQIQLLEDQRSATQRAWRKQHNKIQNCLADFAGASTLQNEIMFLETKIDILITTQEQLSAALEDNLQAKRVALKKFEKCEDEHYAALKRLNQRVKEIRREKASTHSSTSYSGTTSALERKADIAAKVAKLKTELTFADVEAQKTAALREQQEELKKLKLSKKLALAQAYMDAVNRVEDSASGVYDRQDIFPETTDTRDLLQEYLSTQAQSVPMVSLPTLETNRIDF